MPGQQPPIPSFSVGEILTARKLTQLGDGVRANNERLGFRRDVRASQVVVFARITGVTNDEYEAEQTDAEGNVLPGGLVWGGNGNPTLREATRARNLQPGPVVQVVEVAAGALDPDGSWVFSLGASRVVFFEFTDDQNRGRLADGSLINISSAWETTDGEDGVALLRDGLQALVISQPTGGETYEIAQRLPSGRLGFDELRAT